MKLADLTRSETKRPVYTAPVADVDGNKRYELSITGPSAPVIEEVFAKSEFEIEIAPGARPEEFDEQSRRFLKRHMGDHKFSEPPLDDITALLKRKPPLAPENLKDSVTVYLRPTEGEGTFYGLWIPVMAVLPGVPISFVLPRVWTTWSVVVPWAGNPNIILFRDAPLPPPVATAVAAGIAVEGVAFTVPPVPWAQFRPLHFVVNGVVGAGALTNFGMGGHSVPWLF
jgi:hypothetical protein